jgi:hypothetical protein
MNRTYGKIALPFLAIPGGCATASVMDLDSNTVQVSAGAAPVCGAIGAQNYAVKTAAYQTLRRGFDKYVIVGAQATAHDKLTGFTPTYANSNLSGTYSGYGNMGTFNGYSNTTISGGQPIIMTEHGQNLVVHMFHANDPGAENAIDAKTALGPEWQKILAKGPGNTCTN